MTSPLDLDRLAALCQVTTDYNDLAMRRKLAYDALPALIVECRRLRAGIQAEADACQAKISDLVAQSQAPDIDADTRTYHEALCFHYSQIQMRLLARLNEASQ